MINISSIKISSQAKQAVQKTLDSGCLVQGERVEELENLFSQHCQTRYAIATNTGTAALHTALFAAGVTKTDEVITSPFTFVATANAILMSSAKPVFADIDPQTFNLDPKSVKQKITDKTKAILTVDLYGLPSDYRTLQEIAKKNQLVLMADSCQAVGAKYYKQPVGSLVDISVFSLYATKNIMSAEGGMITTNDKRYAQRSQSFRNHGQRLRTKYNYEDIGLNYRMTDVLASIGIEQFKKVGQLTKIRNRNARKLSAGLKEIDEVITPPIPKNKTHAFHQYTIRVKKGKQVRDSLQKFLAKKQIESKVYYPKPLHMFNHLSTAKVDTLPIAEEIASQVLSLPVHPNLSVKDIQSIVQAIKQWSNHEK